MTESCTIPDDPTYAVIGSGAVGAYYGGCLQRLGREVHFHCYRDAEHIKLHGLRIDSHTGDFVLPTVHTYADVKDMPRCDVVIVALKTTNNHLLPGLLPPTMKDDGVALVLQNGLGIESQVAQIVGHKRVMGGLCFICSHKIGPGHIHHTDYGRVEFADHTQDGKPAGITPRLRTVARDFELAGNPVVLNEDLALARWRKLVWNVPFNGLSVVLDTDTASIMADPAVRARAHGLMREVQSAAKACIGRTIDDDFVQMMLDWTDNMEPYLPSMKIDCDTGRPMEVEAIFGAPLRAAREAGCHVPGLAVVYERLCEIEAARMKSTPAAGS
jgi:2-dehydropantoate 2-reductase